MLRHINLRKTTGLLAALLLSTTSFAWAMSLTGAGATFPYPVYAKWFDAYHKATGVAINYQALGSGAGIQQLRANTVDFGASDAPLSNAELRSFHRAVLHIPTVAGAVVMSYNVRGVPTHLHLTPQIIAGIYLGHIRNWDDRAIKAVNPGIHFPNLPIVVVHRADASGTTYIFTHYLAAVSPEWARRVGAEKSVNWPVGIGGKGNPGVAALIKQEPGGFGYVELAYTVVNHMPAALVRNRAGVWMQASIASTRAAANGALARMQKDVRAVIVNSPAKDAYPIAGFTYILIYKYPTNCTKAKAVVRFLEWEMHNGAAYARSLYYCPLPASLVKVNERALRSMRCRKTGKPVI